MMRISRDRLMDKYEGFFFFFLGFSVFCFLVEECCLWQQEKMK